MTALPFNSINEAKKPTGKRRHHNNDECPSGHDIPRNERRQGTAGYTLCRHCKDINAEARSHASKLMAKSP
jgi:hypothetical protein